MEEKLLLLSFLMTPTKNPTGLQPRDELAMFSLREPLEAFRPISLRGFSNSGFPFA